MRLKDLREDRDETQRQMAALLNVGQSTYSMYENGQREIPWQPFANWQTTMM